MQKLAVTMMVTCLLFSAAATLAQSKDDLVHPSLVASVSVTKPGEPFTVGVLLRIKPDWHVYWSNPGDAGLPTRVQWTLPAGYTASELRFPVPEHIDQPGGIVIYGYQNDVLLTSTITPPATAGSTQVDIAAKVTWLCCSEDCVPGHATLNLQLMTADKSVPDNTQLFADWQHRLPIHAAASAAPLNISEASPHTQIVSSRKITDTKAVIPGAVDGMILTLGSPQPTAGGTSIPLTAKVLQGQTVTAASVPILLTWADPGGTARLGEEITVPIVTGH